MTTPAHQLLADVPLTGPRVQQGMAARLLDQLSEAVGSARTISVGTLELDAIDVVRASAILGIAEAFALLEILDAARSTNQLHLLDLVVPRRSARAVVAAEWHGSRNPHALRSLIPSLIAEGRASAARTARVARAARPSTLLSSLPPEVNAALVAQTPSHVRVLAPLIEPLSRSSNLRIAVLTAHRATADAAHALNLIPQGPRPGPSTSAPSRAHRDASRHLARLARDAPRPSGVPADQWEVARRVLAVVLRRDLPDALAVAEASAAWIATGHLRVLLGGNPATPWGRAACSLAQQSGLPVAVLQHGTIFPRDPRWERCPVDRHLVWGEASRSALLSSGVSSKHIVITGSPHHHTTHARAPQARGSVPHVLVATSGAGDSVSIDQHLSFIDLLAGAIRSAPQVRWTVKLHPKDSPALYLRLPEFGEQSTPGRATIAHGRGPTARTIESFLDEVTVLVTVTSTAALDALRAGIPVIIVRPANPDAPDAYGIVDPCSAISPVHTVDELVAAVWELTERSVVASASTLSAHFAHEEDATERAVAAIASLVDPSR